MLDKKRIKEAENNVKRYLEEGLLKKIKEHNDDIFNTFKKNSEESLKVADLLSNNSLSWLWAVVCSYYSMFYIVNAVIYKMCYKIGDKIEMAAAKEGKKAEDIANFYWKIFREDFKKLRIAEPDIWCKATDNITEQ